MTNSSPQFPPSARTQSVVPDGMPQPNCGRHVLLIEDQQAMRAALRDYLQLDDHEVEVAGSLGELDTLLDEMKSPPDIVISDFHLGNERGSDAIERIWTKFGNHIPAIVLTGDTSQIPVQFGALPAIRMLNKPVSAKVLTATMNELLPHP